MSGGNKKIILPHVLLQVVISLPTKVWQVELLAHLAVGQSSTCMSCRTSVEGLQQGYGNYCSGWWLLDTRVEGVSSAVLRVYLPQKKKINVRKIDGWWWAF